MQYDHAIRILERALRETTETGHFALSSIALLNKTAITRGEGPEYGSQRAANTQRAEQAKSESLDLEAAISALRSQRAKFNKENEGP